MSAGESRIVVAATLLVVGALVRFVGPSAWGWYHDDDFENLRWTLEYRDAPWFALTARHSLHDHIRPLTLLALWLGAWMSDGEFWGQHLVETTLAVLAVGGVAVLGRDLSGRWLGGVTSALLAVSLTGFERMMGWTAWICSAGEVCCGIWSLVAARRALERPAYLLAAAPLVVAAGLFKEPGSVVYPAAAVVMAAGAWQAGRRGWTVLGVGSLIFVGALTFAFTWDPGNLVRMGGDEGAGLEQAATSLRLQPALMLDFWPGPSQVGAGVPLLLFVPVVAESLRASWMGRSASPVRLSLILMAFLTVATFLTPFAMVPLAFLALIAGRREPSALPLALYLANVLVLLPFPTFGGVEVSLIGGGFGLALYVGVELTGWLGRTGGWSRRRFFAVALAFGLPAVLLGFRLVQPIRWDDFDRQRARGRMIFAIGSLAQALDVTEAKLAGIDMSFAWIMPLFGLSVSGAQLDEPARVGTVVIPRGLTLAADASRIRQVAIEGNLIPETELATAGAEGAMRAGSVSLAATEGYYLIGIARTRAGSRGPSVHAHDECRNQWEITQGDGPTVLLYALPFYVAPRCGPLKVAWTEQDGGAPVLAQIAAPTTNFWSGEAVPHLLDVTSAVPPRLQPGRPSGGPTPGQGRRQLPR